MKDGKKFLVLPAIGLMLILGGCTFQLGAGGGTASGGKADGGIFKSIDGGKLWAQKIAVPVTGGKIASIANVDVRRITIDPSDNQAIYLSTENDGIVYSYDGGDSWRKFSQLNRGQVRAVAVDPKSKCVLYAVSGNKLYKSVDCGRIWQNIYYHQKATVLLTDIAIDSFNTSNLYLVNDDGEIIKSKNAGQTWATVYHSKGAFVDLAMDPRNSRIIYAATTKEGIFKTADSGQTWISLGDGLKSYSGSHEYKKLVIDSAAPNALILISKYGMLRTVNGGESWDVINLILAPKEATIYSVAVNPKDSKIIYYATRTTLVKTIDGGKTWSSSKLPFTRLANAIAIDPVETGTVYLGAFKPKE